MNGVIMIMSTAAAAKKFKINRNTLGSKMNEKPAPIFAFVEIGKKRPKIDTEHISFKEYVAVQRSQQLQNASPEFRADIIRKTKTAPSTKIKRTPQAKTQSEDMTEDELEELAENSARATLEMPIVKLDLEKYKVEQEKLKIQKNCSGVIQWQLAEYLFFGFGDRIAAESLQSVKKKRAAIRRTLSELLIQRLPDAKLPEDVDVALREFLKSSEVNEMATSIINSVTAEIQEIVKNVKIAQAAAVENWKEEDAKTNG